MKEIGGFFGLEVTNKKEYHHKAYRVNSGRNALECLITAKGIAKLQIPKYICNSVISTLEKMGVDYQFYDLTPSFFPSLSNNYKYDFILYINYFGLFTKNVRILEDINKNMIIDNTQAFFVRPRKGSNTFYSPRKFFGVSDGGYFYSDILIHERWPQDYSYERFEHLLKRIDKSAREAYYSYIQNEYLISNLPVREMSKLTQEILKNLNYQKICMKRTENFNYLHDRLNETNHFPQNFDLKIKGPLIYPYISKRKGLRDFLINNKVFVATYWPEVLEITKSDSFEYYIAKNTVPLPIDQRYGHKEMESIVNLILLYEKGL